MSNPFKFLKYWKVKIFLVIIGLELLKTLIMPNPIDVLILIGLITVFIACFYDEFC